MNANLLFVWLYFLRRKVSFEKEIYTEPQKYTRQKF